MSCAAKNEAESSSPQTELMYLDAFIVIDRILGEKGGGGGKEVVCEVRKGARVDRA